MNIVYRLPFILSVNPSVKFRHFGVSLQWYVGTAVEVPDVFRILVVNTGSIKEQFAMRYIQPAVELAYAKAKTMGVNFDITYADDGPNSKCDSLDVSSLLGLTSKSMADPKYNTSGPLDFLIGPSCNADMKAVAQLAIAKTILAVTNQAPMISDILGLTPSINRVSFSLKWSLMPIMQMCIENGWLNVAIIWYQCNPLNKTDAANFKHEERTQALDAILPDLKKISPNLNVTYIIHNYLDKTSINISRNLGQAKNISRTIVFFLPQPEMKDYLLQAYNMGMTLGDYALFTADTYSRLFMSDSTLTSSTSKVDEKDLPVMRQILSMMLISSTEMYIDDPGREQYRGQVRAYVASNPNITGSGQTGLNVENYCHMANVYDTVMLLAGAILKLSADGKLAAYRAMPASTDKVKLIASYLINRTISHQDFQIASTASYVINDVGDKLENYYIRSVIQKTTNPIIRNLTQDDYAVVFTYDSRTNQSWTTRAINWPDGIGPQNNPPCGYTGLEGTCSPDAWKEKLYYTIIAPLFMISFGIFWYFYRRYLDEKRIESECIANPADLLVINPDEEYRVRKEKLNKMKKATNDLEREANANNSFSSGIESYTGHSLNSAGLSGGMSQFKRRDHNRSHTGFWRKAIVTVRWTHKKSVYLSQKAIREIQLIRAMEHDNLAICIGACVAKEMALVIYEYCPRGTVQELIERSDEKFDWTMRIAFLEDIIRGLSFLQNSVLGCHGRLTSDCCQIDGRFVVRLSDYGLSSFFSHNNLENWVAMRSKRFSEGQLWQAPEQLQLPDDEAVKHTTELDVYAFGIILQEIILRSYPYSMYQNTMDYETVCTYMRVGKLLDDKPLRPFFPPNSTGTADPGLMDLAAKCWAQDPQQRPKLHYIKESIIESAGNMGIAGNGSIMDMLMAQMDQQNARLQAIVEEKGKDILNEKLQADKIITACFQKEFSEKLKHNQYISPEAMEIVTVLLVQIAHFEHILADSTPAQLVEVLNLYNHFIDKAVTRFDCFKIEMEMDLTTVASGVPKKNGILNAREICRLALTLQYRIRELRFHHRPNDPVKLQMGVHSGSCVAAVVGKLVPRYMLFGDTLEITKRMLVTGTIQRIQISSYTKDVLETFGSFRTEERGEVFVRGKGALTTYWLTGEDGNKELKTLRTKYEASLFVDHEES